jgi:hypothetical protein
VAGEEFGYPQSSTIIPECVLFGNGKALKENHDCLPVRVRPQTGQVTLIGQPQGLRIEKGIVTFHIVTMGYANLIPASPVVTRSCP